MAKRAILINIFSIFIIFNIISLSLSQPSLDEDEDREEDEPEMVVGYISLKFKISQGMLLVPVKVGTPEQEINLVIDIGSSRTWISDQSFKKGDSSSLDESTDPEEKEQYDFKYSGNAATETFTLANKKLEKFKFLLVNSLQNTKMQGALSLGHEYDSKHKSLVYEMSHVCNTFYNMFLFQFGEGDEGELLIGDITEDQKRKYQYINKCLFLKGGSAEDQIKWRCELTQMFIGGIEDFPTFRDNMMEQTGYYISKTDYNKMIDVKEPVVFETIFDKIYVPKKTMEYLKDNYLKNLNDGNKMCSYNDNGNNVKVTCSRDEVSKLKRLNFVLSAKTALAFPSDALFSCGNNKKGALGLKIKSFNDKRIKLVKNEENLGLTKTLEKALKMAQNDWIAFLESDDLWAENYLEEKVKIIEKYPDTAIIFNDVEEFGDEEWLKAVKNNFTRTRNILNKKKFPKNIFYKTVSIRLTVFFLDKELYNFRFNFESI